MTHDKVAVAFAKWTAAHREYIEANKRLKIAHDVARKIGTLPPLYLEEEVRQLKQTADELLAEATRELNKSRGT